jgi:hypothetical protein
MMLPTSRFTHPFKRRVKQRVKEVNRKSQIANYGRGDVTGGK